MRLNLTAQLGDARFFSIVGSVLGSRNKEVNFFSHKLGGWDKHVYTTIYIIDN